MTARARMTSCPVCGGDEDPCLVCAAWAELDRGEIDDLEIIALCDRTDDRREIRSWRRSLVERGLVEHHPRGGPTLTGLGIEVVRAMGAI